VATTGRAGILDAVLDRPTVAITVPTAGTTVIGTTTVTATATDNVGIAGVQFKLDGANLGAEDTTAPYSVAWTTTTATNDTHTLTAVARDAAGNSTTSAIAGNLAVSSDSAFKTADPPRGKKHKKEWFDGLLDSLKGMF